MIPTDIIFLFIIRVVFFMIRVDPSPILFYFYFFIRSELVRVDPSWSDPDWRSELIRLDFCTCLNKLRTFVLDEISAKFRSIFCCSPCEISETRWWTETKVRCMNRNLVAKFRESFTKFRVINVTKIRFELSGISLRRTEISLLISS